VRFVGAEICYCEPVIPNIRPIPNEFVILNPQVTQHQITLLRAPVDVSFEGDRHTARRQAAPFGSRESESWPHTVRPWAWIELLPNVEFQRNCVPAEYFSFNRVLHTIVKPICFWYLNGI